MNIRQILENAQGTVRNSYDSGIDAMIDRLGLEQKRSTTDVLLPLLAIFGVGLTAGAALGLIFAPKRGTELRTDLRHRFDDMKELGVEKYESMRTQTEAPTDTQTSKKHKHTA